MTEKRYLTGLYGIVPLGVDVQITGFKVAFCPKPCAAAVRAGQICWHRFLQDPTTSGRRLSSNKDCSNNNSLSSCSSFLAFYLFSPVKVKVRTETPPSIMDNSNPPPCCGRYPTLILPFLGSRRVSFVQVLVLDPSSASFLISPQSPFPAVSHPIRERRDPIQCQDAMHMATNSLQRRLPHRK